VDEFRWTPGQQALVEAAWDHSIFVAGPAGAGKTTASAGRLLRMLHAGISGDDILVLLPQRSLARAYEEVLSRPDLPPGSRADVLTISGLARRMVDLFWPAIAAGAGFSHPERQPVFLDLETSQYFLNRLVRPLLDEGYFETVAIEPNRLLAQVLNNLNKAAAVGFDYTSVGERLKSAWVGEPAQQHVYDEAQECANRFRRFCLENNLLDFSLQLEIFNHNLWPLEMCQRYLKERYHHLIYDNVEEDIPLMHDIIRSWLPELTSGVLVYNHMGGYRTFLGADPLSGEALRSACDQTIEMQESLVTPPHLQAFSQVFGATLLQHSTDPYAAEQPAFTYTFHRYFPEMIAWVCQEIAGLLDEQRIPPEEIVILAPFLSDSLRFSLINRLESLHVPVRSYRPSRSLREEPATGCLLTLARLAHPHWELAPSVQEVRSAFMQSIAGLDLVRADLLARIVYRQAGLGPFDQIQAQTGIPERITYALGEKYEALRQWLEDYRAGEPEVLDVFLSRLFGEVLSQPGFGFHQNFDAAAVTKHLIDSARRFRWAVEDVAGQEGISTGKEYVENVAQGILGAQYLPGENTEDLHAVMLAPAYTYLMTDRPVQVQFWLDIGNLGWWERIDQPLTHPYVLSRNWSPDTIWTDEEEFQANNQSLARLVAGLVDRCKQEIYLTTTGMNEQGDEPRGPLLVTVQTLLRRNADIGVVGNV
jgi:hypothetical protein